MDKLNKRICFILAVTIFISSAIGTTVYAEHTVWSEVVEEAYSLGDEHTEEAIETTTEGIIMDEVESSSGVVVNIIEGIKNIFRGDEEIEYDDNEIIIPDEIVSDSALDFELDLSNIPEEAVDLVKSRKKYSKLSKQDKYILQEYAHVRKDTMKICEEAGYSINESIPKAIMMQQLNVGLRDTLKMIQSYGSETVAVNQAEKYREKEFDAGILSKEDIKSDLTDYLVKGYTADEVINAFVVSECMNENIETVIIDESDNIVHTDRESLMQKAEETIFEDVIASSQSIQFFRSIDEEDDISSEKQYSVKTEVLENYLNDNNVTINEFENQIYEKSIDLGINEPVAMYSNTRASSETNSLDKDSKYKTGPSIYNNGINDSVNMNTGELIFTHNICNIPGLNGLDLNLYLKYSSSAQKYNKADNRFGIPNNWSLSVPYLLDEQNTDKDYYEFRNPKYVVLGNGVSHKLGGSVTDTDEYGKKVDKYDIPMSFDSCRYLAKDRDSVGGNDAKYYLKYTDGRRENFDSSGKWISTYDRFGNSIELLKSGSIYEITDSLGNIIRISLSAHSSTTFTFPDGTSYSIYYDMYQTPNIGHAVVNRINDRNNLNTTFTYTALADDTSTDNGKYSNPLVSSITSPTGMKNRYVYELAEVQYSEDIYEEDKYGDLEIAKAKYYPRIHEKWIEYESNKYNDEVYEYSSKNYTLANSVPLVFKSGTIGSIYTNTCKLPFYNDDKFECYECGALLTALLYGGIVLGKRVYTGTGSSEYSYLNLTDLDYFTTIKSDGVRQTQTFDYLHRLKSNVTTYDNGGSTDVIYEYEDVDRKYYGIPVPKEIKIIDTDEITGTTNTRTENYAYDHFGNVTKYSVTGPSGLMHKETHKYDVAEDFKDDAHYWLETEATYQKNGSETITVINALDEDDYYIGSTNKIIMNTTTKVGNSVKAYTEYDYFNDYTLKSKTEYATMTSAGNSNTTFVKTAYGYGMDNGEWTAAPTHVNITDNISGSNITTEYEYDFDGNTTLIKDGRGYYTAYAYDKYGNVVKETHAKSKNSLETVQNKKYIYNYTAGKCTVTDENNHSVVYTYDKAGNMLNAVGSGVTLAKFTYDAKMRPETYEEGKAKTTYTYDGRDRIISEVIKEGTKTLSNKTYTYEINGTGLKTTEKINGDSTSSAITNITQNDVMGRSTMVNEAGNITYYTYDMLGNVTKAQNYITKTSDRTVYLTMDYTYDYAGNVLSTTRTDDTDTVNAKKTYAAYDMLGRMITSTDGKGYTTEYKYNALNQVINKKVPFNVESNGNIQYTNYSYSYDNAGNVTNESVTSGVSNSYTYDYRNRLTQASSGLQTVKYVYDDAGNMIQYNTANGTQVHKYVYDGLNRLTKYTDALNRSETYTYDSNNDIIKKADRNGITTNYTYDGLHRMLTESVKKDYITTTNTYVYGATGGVISENAKNVKYSNTVLSDVTKTYTYNSAGLPSTETTKIGNDSFRINRYYDTRGNDREDSYYKNGTLYRKMKYVYDNKNRLVGVYDVDINTGTQSMKAQYGYDKNDNNNLIHYGNGGATITTFNAANLPVRLYNSNGSVIYNDYSYNYRLDGNVLSKTEKINGETTNTAYTYDSTGRLTSETVTGYDNFSMTYTYDNAGNRESLIFRNNDEDILEDNYTETYRYDKNNRLTETIKNYGATSDYTEYEYDNNGNQSGIYKYSKNNEGIFKLKVISATFKNNTGRETFTYNGLNQLIEYTDTNGKYNGKTGLNASYVYMANGYRLSKTVNGEETKYLWDKDNIVSELNSENVRMQTYYRGYNLISDDTNRYYMHNAHGDVVEVFTGKNEGNIYYYNAFGTTSHYENTEIPNKWGYCDQLKDFETGNYYMRARYYNPDTGRFISEDPIKDGSNWYSYCGGNPVMYKDPSGNIVESDYQYGSFVQLQLLEYTVKYLDAKLIGDTNAMNTAANAANDLRASSKKKMFPGLGDQLNVDIRFYVVTGNQLAKDLGLVEGSDEYAVVVTSFVLQCLEARDDINSSYAAESAFIALGAYINNYTATRGISPTNTKQVYKDYKSVDNNSQNSVGKAFDPNGSTVQQGVDPKTLTPGKDLNTLDDTRLKNSIKYGGDKSIIVDRNGKVLDGNHRLKYALDNNKAVDITIGY